MVRLKQSSCVEESIWGRYELKSLSFFSLSLFQRVCSVARVTWKNVVMREWPGYNVPHYVCMWIEGRGWSEATLPRATIHDDGPFLFWNRRKEGADKRKELNPSCHQHFSSKLLSKAAFHLVKLCAEQTSINPTEKK